jgi:uncharacterized membrane protein
MSYRNLGVFFGHTATLERLNALTDGVYAIAITLLVLDLKTPDTPGLTNVQLLTDLQKQIPNFIAYAISFYMVAFLWMRNYWILKHLHKCAEKTFWLNFGHLMFVSLIPYAASLIGHYDRDPIAVMIFSGCLGMASFSLLILHRSVVPKREWHHEDAPNLWTNPNWWAMYPAPLFALGSILISFISVNGAIALWFLTPIWAGIFSRHYR